MTALRRFWQGDVPLGEAFWLWGILGGGVLALFATLFGLMLLTFGAPPWLVVVLIVGHIPFNVFLLVGVWRSAGGSAVGETVRLVARICMSVWAVVLSVT
jgi:hypothetical protein